LLGNKKLKEAIEVLRLNVEAFPQSANVYDSLGEAYLNAADKARALENYQRSLELDPGNAGAAEKVKQLKSQHSPE
jgi:cytochrome c-type biogenesis protein CcmH/NrfG